MATIIMSDNVESLKNMQFACKEISSERWGSETELWVMSYVWALSYQGQRPV